jgi:hypothetical protein
MINPVACEEQFQEFKKNLPILSSERLKIKKCREFLNYLTTNYPPNYLNAYLYELISIMTKSAYAADFTGTNIGFLKDLVKDLQSLAADSDATSKQEIDNLIDKFSYEIERIKNESAQRAGIESYKNRDTNNAGISVPLVEDDLITDDESPSFASVKKLHCNLVLRSDNDPDEIHFGQLIDHDSQVYLEGDIETAKNIIGDLTGLNVNQKLRIGIWTNGKFSLTGKSAHLAITLMVALEILKKIDPGNKYYANPHACFTGLCNSTGEVLSVDEGGLKLKVEACFFSNHKYFILPESQETIALEYLKELKENNPDISDLNIVAVGNIKDIFSDSRLISIEKVNIVIRGGRFIRRQKKIIGIVLIILFIAGLFEILYSRTNPNPAAAELNGNSLSILNKYKREILQIDLNKGNSYNRDNIYDDIAFGDLNNNGKKDVVFKDTGKKGINRLIAVTIEGDTLWNRPLRKNIDIPNNPVDASYILRKIKLEDCDGDGRYEVYAVAINSFYPSIVLQLDAETGRERQCYVNSGDLMDIHFADINGDSTKEILLSGINNDWGGGCFIVLDPLNFTGHSPTLNDKYAVKGIRGYSEIAYLIFPRTPLGNKIETDNNWINGKEIIVNYKSKWIRLKMEEGFFNSDIVSFYPVINFKLNIIGIQTSASFDRAADYYYKTGGIKMMVDSKYLMRKYKKRIIAVRGSCLSDHK